MEKPTSVIVLGRLVAELIDDAVTDPAQLAELARLRQSGPQSEIVLPQLVCSFVDQAPEKDG
jgi:hypothetical protein